MKVMICNAAGLSSSDLAHVGLFEWIIAWQRSEIPTEIHSKTVSILEMVEENSDRYRKLFLDLVRDIHCKKSHGESVYDVLKKTDKEVYWWMSLLTEKSNMFKSPEIEDIIKILALREWFINNRPCHVRYFGPVDNTLECLKRLCCELRISLDYSAVEEKNTFNRSLLKSVYDSLPTLVRAFLYLIRYFKNNFHFIFGQDRLDKWEASEGEWTFVSYTDGVRSIDDKSGTYSNGYWGDLLNQSWIKDKKVNALYLYAKNPSSLSPQDAILTMSRLSKNLNQSHICVDQFWSYKLIVPLLRNYIELCFLHRKIAKTTENIPENDIRVVLPLLRGLILESFVGPVALQNIIFFLLFKEAFSRLNRQDKCIFVQENQGWEFGMSKAWKQAGHAQIVGFIHTPLRDWDLRYFYREKDIFAGSGLSVPVPDMSICGFELDRQKLVNFGYAEEKLVVLEPLRYMNVLLSEPSFCEQSTSILVLGEYEKSKTFRLLSSLKSIRSGIQNDVSILLKPHPNTPIDVGLFPELKIEVVQGAMTDLVSRARVAYAFASSTAAFDVAVLGCPIITLLSRKKFNASPLRGGPSVIFVKNEAELSAAIREVFSSEYGFEKEKPLKNFGAERGLIRWKNFLIES